MIRTLTFTESTYDGSTYARVDQMLRTRCRYTGRVERLHVGYQMPTGAGRMTVGGPKVPGPWTASHADSSVIDTAGGTLGDLERKRIAYVRNAAELIAAGALTTAAHNLAKALDQIIDCEPGDLFLLDGELWELRDDRRTDYPRLERLEIVNDPPVQLHTAEELRTIRRLPNEQLERMARAL